MKLLRPLSAPPPHFPPSAAANRSTATLSFHLQSTFNRNASPRHLSVFSHPRHLKMNYNHTLRFRPLPPLSANANPPPPPPPPHPDSDARNRKLLVLACAAVTVALAIANRVLYKLALVPMKEYPFFLAQLTTFGYVAIYFSTLFTRYKAGIVTDEMLAFPKTPFIVIGLLEALGVVAGMYSGAQLPGPAIPILTQAFLVWQLAFSMLILGRRYSWNRLAGCVLVAAGVVLSVTSGSEQDQMLSGVGMIWPAMMITSTAFQAVASVLKESVFIDAATRLKGKLLDIFVVNSYGSGFQALFVLLFLPVLSNLKGIPLPELPSYLKSGAGCFFNIGTDTTGCDGAPLLPLLYIITNIAFNISALNLLKYSSAVVSSLAVMSSVPISIYILSLPLPYIPGGVTLSPFFVMGSVVLMLGLILYNFSWPLKQDSDIFVDGWLWLRDHLMFKVVHISRALIKHLSNTSTRLYPGCDICDLGADVPLLPKHPAKASGQAPPLPPPFPAPGQAPLRRRRPAPLRRRRPPRRGRGRPSHRPRPHRRRIPHPQGAGPREARLPDLRPGLARHRAVAARREDAHRRREEGCAAQAGGAGRRNSGITAKGYLAAAAGVFIIKALIFSSLLINLSLLIFYISTLPLSVINRYNCHFHPVINTPSVRE